MAPKRPTYELKVGIFAFGGLLILITFVLYIGNIYLFNPGYLITVRFRSANGIEPGAPVHVAGVVSGELKDLQVKFEEGDTLVDLKVWIQEGTQIADNSRAEIKTLGLLGEKYLDILPQPNPVSFLKQGDLLEGKDPVSMDDVVARSHQLVARLEVAADSLNHILERVEAGEGTIGKLLADDTLHRQMTELMEDLKRHPWKLLHRPREKKEDKEENRRSRR